MKINKIIETVLYCDDVKEMLDFYQDLFNFPANKHLPRSVFLKCGENVLVIMNRSMTSQENQLPPHHGATGAQHIALEVEDSEYDEWKALFVKKGLPIEKEITWDGHHGARSFFFRDPAGNNIEIAEKKLWGSEIYEDK